MRKNPGLAAMALMVALGQGIVAAPRAAAAAAADEASEIVAGEVTKIDLDRSRVTVRSSDGKPHEFEASAETLKDLKVGDQIEAKRRPEQN
jgi:Cu/Ag efflux protein CusF